MRRRPSAHPRRGEIYLVNFDPTVGAEIRKTRPALVLQNDTANRHSPITIVAAVSSKFELPLYPAEVLVKPPDGGLVSECVVLLNQVRSVDRSRLVKRLGALKAETMVAVDQAIQISFGLVTF